ncbi:hypothetical protein QJS04_geneDACA020276 [Acorus gramineus]|uniref:Uncharacterized protein n=1 Tax=Acorus gramineus TaxID=55184 RepID=A0AAV9A3V2_ACOGR|nr:hypothetical protein QJS04_geneDACA020276 [Acorus gramineus]
MEKRLIGWSSQSLSLGGKLMLLQAVLSSLPVFYLSIFKLPKGVLHRLDVLRRCFLWNETDREIRRPHLVRRDLACLPCDKGGLGISTYWKK